MTRHFTECNQAMAAACSTLLVEKSPIEKTDATKQSLSQQGKAICRMGSDNNDLLPGRKPSAALIAALQAVSEMEDEI